MARARLLLAFATLAALVAAACASIDGLAGGRDTAGEGGADVGAVDGATTIDAGRSDGAGGDGNPPEDADASSWCSTQSAPFCVDFDLPGTSVSMPATTSGGTIDLVTGDVRSPPRALRSTGTASASASGTGTWGFGPYSPAGLKLHYAFKVDQLTGNAVTIFAGLSFGRYILHIGLTPINISVEWYDTVTDARVSGIAVVDPWTTGVWNDVVLQVNSDGVHNKLGTLLLGPPPLALSDASGVILGIIDNPTGFAAAVRYDDLSIAP